MLKFHISIGSSILFAILLLSYSPSAGADFEIIGAGKCKVCHKAKTGDQWKIWTESVHAKAFETLASEEAKKIAGEMGLGDPQTEESCLKCHATRSFLGDGVLLSEKGNYADSEGVGCEACHGPGSDYKSKRVMMDPVATRAAGMVSDKSAEACARCHNPQSPTFKSFDFAKRWAEIAHPVQQIQAQQVAIPIDTTDMPGEIVFESSVGNVRFPHDVHVVDEKLECIECHHQIQATELDTPHPAYMTSSWINCRTCHNPESETGKKYYKCSDCHHSDVENIADETLSAKVVTHKSCWACHATGNGVEASNGCADCHVKEQD